MVRPDMDADERVHVPVGAGAVAGSLAWLLGYLVTYVATIDRVREGWSTQFLQLLVDETVDWKAVGWLFFNAHDVAVRIPRFFIWPASSLNLVAADDGSFGYLYLLPPLALTLSGALVARYGRNGRRRLLDAGIAGATVAVGYVCWCVVGLLAFVVAVEGERIGVDPVPAVLLAGLAYPLAFGALGGVLGELVAGRLE